MTNITAKTHHNYVAAFLTLACNLACPYCINLHALKARSARVGGGHMDADRWIAAINRFVLRDDLPLTLQGGEPTLHKGFYRIVNEVKPEIKMDLMTNLTFDADEFIMNAPVWRFTREAPYAAIRASYHPGQNNIDELIAKTLKLQDAGFRVGLYGIDHPAPDICGHIKEVQLRCQKLGLDFRTKEFLGKYEGVIHGTFKYDDCVNGEKLRSSICKTTEIIADPSGNIFRCHADLYKARSPIAHILDEDFSVETIDRFRRCDNYGDCNPCDVKVKTNRFQIYGHTSVEIRQIQ
jgi:hypothetical protein